MIIFHCRHAPIFRRKANLVNDLLASADYLASRFI
jgi:hypothetical protein